MPPNENLFALAYRQLIDEKEQEYHLELKRYTELSLLSDQLTSAISLKKAMHNLTDL